MKTMAVFLAGFATGWAVRATTDSSRGVVVGALSGAYGLVDRARKLVALEREQLEDLIAEARAHYEVSRSNRSTGVDPPANKPNGARHGEEYQA